MERSEDKTQDDVSSGRSRLFFPLLILAGFILGLALGWLIIRLISDSGIVGGDDYFGNMIDPSQPASDFVLTAHNGERVNLNNFDDQVLLLYFGYTYCPDVCPATLAQLARAISELSPEERDQVQIAMITVDPERDSQEVLADYMGHFHPSFLGLRGSENETEETANAYGVYYERQAGDTNEDYLVNHTASIFVVDKNGHLRMIYSFGTPGENIASDLRKLLAQ